MSKSIKIILDNENKTQLIAKLIAKNSLNTTQKNLVIFLKGNLGAGKTTFSQYFIRAYGFTEKVKSPTYTLIESYCFDTKRIYHLDLYRLTAPEELIFIGIEDILEQKNTIILIEWPEKGEGFLPTPDIMINFELKDTKRNVEIIFDQNTDSFNYLWQELKEL